VAKKIRPGPPNTLARPAALTKDRSLYAVSSSIHMVTVNYSVYSEAGGGTLNNKFGVNAELVPVVKFSRNANWWWNGS